MSFRTPLGVCAGITPFNFPAMIPLWVRNDITTWFHLGFNDFFIQMFPVALVCGNTYVVKPSERDPGACMMLVDMLREAGAPDGVVNVIHGAHDAVNFICDHPDIKAISFVGSDQAVSFYFYYTPFQTNKFGIKGPIYLRARIPCRKARPIEHGGKESRCHHAGRQQGEHSQSTCIAENFYNLKTEHNID